MFKSNKKNVLEFKHKNNTPLLSSNSKGEENKIRIEKIKQRIVLKKNKDINGMEITHSIIKKKLKVYLMLTIINLQNRAIPAWMCVKKLAIK